jgi:hypothetical protein
MMDCTKAAAAIVTSKRANIIFGEIAFAPKRDFNYPHFPFSPFAHPSAQRPPPQNRKLPHLTAVQKSELTDFRSKK